MPRPQHPLTIQGVSLNSVAEQFGTPVYVYDGDKITSQIKTLQQAFSKVPLKIKYATKALTNVNILKVVKLAGGEVDAVSVQEVRLCLEAGFKAEDIMYTPNGVSLEEIKEVVELGAMINLDNLPVLELFGQTYGHEVPVCIRINPHIMAGGNAKISVGHIASKFGVSIHQLDEILELVKKYNIQVTGLHLHTGSDILDAEVFLKSGNVLFEAALKFPELKFLDFGGGFKVGYKEGDVVTDMMEVGNRVSEAFLKFCEKYGKKLELWLEPGKFVVSEAGSLLVQANVVKKTPQITFVGVNSGLNHLIRPMMYDAYHDVYNLSNPEGEEKKYNVVGYICETDTIAAERDIAEVRMGDFLAIKNAGAYGISMASNYNSRLRPAEVLIWEGKARLIRKREEFEDLLRNQVVLDL
ncbi:diaminopimelate decarboxylase [Algoriphagus machipongonensis]|uniref:Diaminopimelate decarboxylase n=1 Tax=Algoriphagus machipongonensis TaxID=388413 RepID=A3HV93_9BACT|nr:diaminopimelate decarboxylase [Algoriphagus machipongonensis]EAZ82065.1 diaminopimelate decarboxylase [Algoriphagus machipongonensis]